MSQLNVFEQIIKHVSKRDFHKSVAKFDGDNRVRKLDCWTWFGSLLFGQLTGHDSIRAIERVFCQGSKRMERLGFSTVRKSTLSDANHIRPLGILEETYARTLKRAQEFSPKGNGFGFKGDVLALDGSVIDLCLSLSPWANFRRETAAVKLHTAVDIAGDLPTFAVITPAKRNEIPIAKQYFHPSAGTTVLIDRGYWDSEWLNSLDKNGVYFVTRQKISNRFKVLKSTPVDRTRGHICDQIVNQIPGKTGPRGRRNKKYFKGKLRRISYRDPLTQKKLIFLTNRFDLDTQTICDLYKARWKVELFFKTLKQNLKVKKFLGNSAHAVKAQILVALIAYLLVQIIRFETKSKVSMPDAMAVVSTLLLLREPISRLFGKLPRITRHPRGSPMQLPLLF